MKIQALLFTTLVCFAAAPGCFAQFDNPDALLEPELVTDDAVDADLSDDAPFNSGGAKTAPLIVGNVPVTRFTDNRNGMTLESTGGVTPGVKILAVDPMGLGRRNGLEKGDIIIDVAGQSISTQRDLENAFRSLPPRFASVEMVVININTGRPQPLQYVLTTNAGSYQTNFGRIDLIETATNVPGVSILEGELHFYNGTVSRIKGTFSSDVFRGTSTFQSVPPAPFELRKSNGMFDGNVNQNGQRRFVMVKRN